MGEAKRKRELRWLGKDHYHPRGGWCPNCGKLLDGASGINTNRKPQPGDISLCLDCCTVLVFSATGVVEPYPGWREDPTNSPELIAQVDDALGKLRLFHAIRQK